MPRSRRLLPRARRRSRARGGVPDTEYVGVEVATRGLYGRETAVYRAFRAALAGVALGTPVCTSGGYRHGGRVRQVRVALERTGPLQTASASVGMRLRAREHAPRPASSPGPARSA
jgi:hypothetical protein